MSNLYDQILKKEAKIGIIGLGYVGLPIALAFAKKASVVGFDINAERVELMKKNIDPSAELESSDFENSDITFTANTDDLKDVKFFIVAVPTPIDDYNKPDLRPLLGASKTPGRMLISALLILFNKKLTFILSVKLSDIRASMYRLPLSFASR